MDTPPRFISAPSRGRGASEITEAKPEIHELDDHRCQYCGATDVEIQLEHINPVSSHGINDPRNFVSACKECNQAKGDRAVTEFLESTEGVIDDVSELPIHGDLIIDTTALPEPYRKIRRTTIDQFRREGRFSGADAYKDLERSFRRRHLWNSDYGYWLTLRFPRIPGQRRATIPIIETILNDTDAPIFDFLLALTEKAQTRRLLDDMLYYREHEGLSAFEAVDAAIEYAPQSDVEAKWANAFGADKEFELTPDLFLPPIATRNSPVGKRELHVIDIHDFREAGDHIKGQIDGWEIRLVGESSGNDVPVRIVDVADDFAQAIPLSDQYQPPEVEYNEERARTVTHTFGATS